MVQASRPFTRRLRLFLRDFRMVEAYAHLAEGQSLLSYFANRKSYVTLKDAHWTGTGEKTEFALVRVAQVFWALAPEGNVSVIAPSSVPRLRKVELQLEGGLLVRASFNMVSGQRLGDFMESGGSFLPAFGAHLMRSGRPPHKTNLVLGDIVLNQESIQAVWEAKAQFQGDLDGERDDEEGNARAVL